SAREHPAAGAVHRRLLDAEERRIPRQAQGLQGQEWPGQGEQRLRQARRGDAADLATGPQGNRFQARRGQVQDGGRQGPARVGARPITSLVQAPPLYWSQQRLRRGWLDRWLSTPQRFLTYGSSMPTNFPADKLQHQEMMLGAPLEQVRGVRDVLMVLPRVSAL